MKRILIYSLIFLALTVDVFAKPGDWIELSSASFTLEEADGLRKLSAAVSDLNALMKHYRPCGAEVSAFKQSIEKFEFIAKAHYAKIIPVSAKVLGLVSHHAISCSGPYNPLGDQIEIDLKQSDELVSANAGFLRIDLCFQNQSNGKISVVGKSFMQEGPDYGTFAGPEIQKTLQDQTIPFVEAVQRTVEELSN